MKESRGEGVVDQIESGIARVELEWREIVHIPVKYLPKGTREGNVLDIIFRLNPAKEKEKREEVRNLQEELLRRSENEQTG